MRSVGEDSLKNNYADEVGLESMFDCFRDPQMVERERLEAKQNKVGTIIFGHALSIGNEMLKAINMGEYIGSRNRETAKEMVNNELSETKQTDAVKEARSAESKRRTAKMMDDVDAMYRDQAKRESEYENEWE